MVSKKGNLVYWLNNTKNIKKEEINLISNQTNLIEDILTPYVDYFYQSESIIFEYILRNKIKPPIKGEITSQKLKRHGIKKIYVPSENKSWLEKRGKRISPIIKFSIRSETSDVL